MSTVVGNLLFLLGYAFPLFFVLLRIKNREAIKDLLFFSTSLFLFLFAFSSSSWIYPWLLNYFSEDNVYFMVAILVLSVVATPVYLTSKYSKYVLPRINRTSLALWATVSFFFVVETALPFWIFFQTIFSLLILLSCFKKDTQSRRNRYFQYVLFVSTLFIVTLIQTWNMVVNEYSNSATDGIALYYLLASLVFLSLHTWQNKSWGRKASFNDVRIDVEITTKEFATQKRSLLQFILFLMFTSFLYINMIFSLLSFEVIIGITFVLMSITLNKYLVIKN